MKPLKYRPQTPTGLMEWATELVSGRLREQTPTDLVEYALDQEPGSEEWRWALLKALKMAGGRGRGQPKKGALGLFAEVDGLWSMWHIHKATGETRPYKLAREAVATDPALVNHAAKASVIGRLARAWKRASGERAKMKETKELLAKLERRAHGRRNTDK